MENESLSLESMTANLGGHGAKEVMIVGYEISSEVAENETEDTDATSNKEKRKYEVLKFCNSNAYVYRELNPMISKSIEDFFDSFNKPADPENKDSILKEQSKQIDHIESKLKKQVENEVYAKIK